MYTPQVAFLVAFYLFFSSATAARLTHRAHGELNAVLKHKRLTAIVANSTVFGGDHQAELQRRDGPKYVFMHHIVGNTYPYTQADWEDDIKQIQAKGVDALALNIGSDTWQPAQVNSAFSAAQALGTNFKLFLSLDFTSLPCDLNDIVSRVNQVAHHPNHFLVNGKPMISSYLGNCLDNAGWASLKAQTNGYLMPFIPGLENNFQSWPSLDSWFCWGCAWPNGNYPKNTDDDNYYLAQLGNRYATTTSGWMFAHVSYKNLYQRGDDWLVNSRWEELVGMRDQLTFVEMVTWNDFGESDYFGPIKGAQPAGTTWATNFPHIAWFDMSEYYIKAFKTGTYPPITQDVIYYWARPHPALATASGDNLPRPSGYDWTQDYLWAAVFATSPCSVTLQVGSSTQTFVNVGQGVTKLKIQLSPGQITVTMVRGGQTVISQTPTDYTFITNPVIYNYNAYVGSAKGGSIAPTTSTTAAITKPTKPVKQAPTVQWTSAGCYVDNPARILRGSFTDKSGMTTEQCINICSAAGFTLAGTEYSTQCLCGSQLFKENGAGVTTGTGECNMPCSGNAGQKCGGGYRTNLYLKPGSPPLAKRITKRKLPWNLF